jgi:hypothetical protein
MKNFSFRPAHPNAFFYAAAKSTRIIDSEITLPDCDYKEVLRARPLAMIVVGGKRFIVVQQSGYGSEAYTIYTLARKIHKAITTFGGGC